VYSVLFSTIASELNFVTNDLVRFYDGYEHKTKISADSSSFRFSLQPCEALH